VRAIFGLGNPGRKYQNTRHNIGYNIIDYLSEYFDVPFKAGRGDYYYTEFSFNNERVILVKPTTYMNRSGECVEHVLRYFPLSETDILIVYDDFNLPFGTLRFRPQGSDGGHNGIRSIINHLHSDSFDRLRFGIGDDFFKAVDHVLSTFTKDESDQLNQLLEISRKGIEYWIINGIDDTMNQFNRSHIEPNTNQ
jgi:PTH1 family peptidyl-tRNA hydrolase